MTKDLGLLVTSNQSTRSRVGLVVDGTNAMAAIMFLSGFFYVPV